MKKGAVIVLKNIFFDSKQFVLKQEQCRVLNKVVQLLTDNPNLKITDQPGHIRHVWAACKIILR